MHPISRPCFCGPRSPINGWARCGPRRRPTIWGTWPPNLSPPIGINHLAGVVPASGIVVAEDGVPRCWWCAGDALYCRYHDLEWGRPVDDDRRLFEKLCLEGFQSGLSWLTILRKRDRFRAAFAQFDIEAV